MDNYNSIMKNHKIFPRWKHLENNWKTILNGCDAILVKEGIDSDDVLKIKTAAFQSWLFKFNFINTISVISKDTFMYYADEDKINFFSFLKPIAVKNGKKVHLCTNIDKNSNVKDFVA